MALTLLSAPSRARARASPIRAGPYFGCRNHKPNEKYSTAWNIKKDISIQGKYDITKSMSFKARCKDRIVTFGKNEQHNCCIFARIQENMRTSERDEKLEIIEKAFNDENGTARERYISIVIEYPARLLNGIMYESLTSSNGRPKPLPEAAITKDHAALSTEPEEEVQNKLVQSRKGNVSIFLLFFCLVTIKKYVHYFEFSYT